MTEFIEVELVGDISKTVHKPQVVEINGKGESFVKRPEGIEIVFHIPMEDEVRERLPDITRLSNSSIEICLKQIQGTLL